MVTARRFQDLVAWQLCDQLSALVFRLTESGKCLADQEFREQIREAAQSAPALISEGFIRYTPAEMVHYLRMARGEIGEVQSRLVHAKSQKYFTDEDWNTVSSLADQAMRVTTALLKSKLPLLKGSKQSRTGR
jgi:four helix bundle protein